MVNKSSGECSLHLSSYELTLLLCAIDTYVYHASEFLKNDASESFRNIVSEHVSAIRELSDTIKCAKCVLENLK